MPVDEKGNSPDQTAQKSTTGNGAATAVSFLSLSSFFALAYLAQGFSSQFGVIAQPLQFFMMKELGQSAGQVSTALAVLWLPWVIKPFYGLICDFVPLFGYRRKSYLILANLLAVLSFGIIATANTLAVILPALVLLATACAISTALMVAQAVEAGRNDGKARDYFSGQVFFYYLANIIAAVAGGALCQMLIPHMALHMAAIVAAVPVIILSILSVFFLKEKKVTAADEIEDGAAKTWQSLKAGLKAPSLWLGAALFACFNFNLSTGVPLYFFESQSLHFSQATIGQLAGWNAVGLLLGSVLYARVLKKLSLQKQLYISIIACTASTLSYLLLVNPTIGIAIELVRGVASISWLLTLYGLAADVCPKRTEASVMAIFLCARNLASEASTFAGGQLFSGAFHNQYQPLVLLAAAFTGAAILLIPKAVDAVDVARARLQH